MRKFWFAIIDIVLLLTIILMTISSHAASIADDINTTSDGAKAMGMEQLHDDEKILDNNNNENDNTSGGDDENENDIVIGDMLLSSDQVNYLYSTDSKERQLENPFVAWPNAKVYYKFDKSQDQKAREIVTNAMSYIQNVSCVRFIEEERQQQQQSPNEKTKHYVLIKKGKACSSEIGMRRQSGPQQMIIDGNLCTKGSVIHELIHCLGFLHMHTANERDEYIKINWDNIRDDAKLNFERFKGDVSMYDTQYDYDSITHYSEIAFAVNKSVPTIIARKPAHNMGQRNEMSMGDIIRLNRMYNCPKENFEVPLMMESRKSQFSNGTITGANKTVDNNDLMRRMMATEGGGESNSNEDATSTLDDDDDDMILGEDQIEALFSLNSVKRNGYKDAVHHWPKGIVPFEIDPTFHPAFVSSIYDSMNYISNRSCIRFVKRTPHNQNYIYITRGPGCSSEVGLRHIGKQMMNINEKLCPRGKIIHELLHSLGFLHMHTANERDNYIRINWENIKEAAKFNFKQFVAHVSMFSTPYDYNSIMHYSTKAFAVNRNTPTIIPLQDAPKLGQREGMSRGDILRLNRMYNCASAQARTVSRSNAEAGVEFLKNAYDDKQKQQPKTIFAMLIFKIVDKN